LRALVDVVLVMAILTEALVAPTARWVVARDVRTNRLFVSHHQVLDQIEKSAQEAPSSATVYLANRPLGSGVAELHAEYLPGWAAVGVIYHPDGVVRGYTIRFVEPDSHLRAFLREEVGTPIANLVVAPDDVPPPPAP